MSSPGVVRAIIKLCAPDRFLLPEKFKGTNHVINCDQSRTKTDTDEASESQDEGKKGREREENRIAAISRDHSNRSWLEYSRERKVPVARAICEGAYASLSSVLLECCLCTGKVKIRESSWTKNGGEKSMLVFHSFTKCSRVFSAQRKGKRIVPPSGGHTPVDIRCWCADRKNLRSAVCR